MRLFFIVYTDCFLNSGMPRSVEMGVIALGKLDESLWECLDQEAGR